MEPKLRILIIRDNTPQLLVRITNEPIEELEQTLYDNHDLLGPFTLLAEIELDEMIHKHLSTLILFDSTFCKGWIRNILQRLILMGIDFQKKRDNTDRMKDNRGW